MGYSRRMSVILTGQRASLLHEIVKGTAQSVTLMVLLLRTIIVLLLENVGQSAPTNRKGMSSKQDHMTIKNKRNCHRRDERHCVVRNELNIDFFSYPFKNLQTATVPHVVCLVLFSLEE